MCHLELRVSGMCKEHGATGSPNKNNPNKYHSMPDDTDEYSRADYFNDPDNSRDLNPTEPMDHGCGSRRE